MKNFTEWLDQREEPRKSLDAILETVSENGVSFDDFWNKWFLPNLAESTDLNEREFINELLNFKNWFGQGSNNAPPLPANNTNAANNLYRNRADMNRQSSQAGVKPTETPYYQKQDQRFQDKVRQANQSLMGLRQQFSQTLKKFVDDVQMKNTQQPNEFSNHHIELAKRLLKHLLPVADQVLTPKWKKAVPGATPPPFQNPQVARPEVKQLGPATNTVGTPA